jgi:hypothetical protein
MKRVLGSCLGLIVDAIPGKARQASLKQACEAPIRHVGHQTCL